MMGQLEQHLSTNVGSFAGVTPGGDSSLAGQQQAGTEVSASCEADNPLGEAQERVEADIRTSQHTTTVDIDARTSKHTLRNAAVIIAAVCALTSVAFALAEPGECVPQPDALGFLTADDLAEWSNRHCYSRQDETEGMTAEDIQKVRSKNGQPPDANAHGHECPPGFRCSGVGRSLAHSLYFVVVTTTTVGYGDVTPHTDAGRLLAVLLIIVNIAFLTTMATVLAEALQGKAQQHAQALEKAARESMRASSSLRQLDSMLSGGLGPEDDDDQAELWRAITRRLAVFVLYVLLGSAAFYFLEEDWDAVECLYFTVVTVSSVGYGDMVLGSAASRLFGVLFATVGIFGTVALAGQCTELYLEHQTATRMKSFAGRDMAAVFAQIDTDRSGAIDIHEYVEFMLIRSGKVKQEDFELIRGAFASLDRNGDGEVTLDEILGVHQ
jgi:voltage-gated potassium channel Kch